MVAVLPEALTVAGREPPALPGLNGQQDIATVDVDPVEALILVANARGSCRTRLDNQGGSCLGRQIACAVGRCTVVMASQQQVDPGVGNRVKRHFLPTDGLAQDAAVVDRKREHRMMSDQNARDVGSAAKGGANELHLLLADPAVLEGQRPRRIDSQHRSPRQFMMGTQRLVDIAFVARQW